MAQCNIVNCEPPPAGWEHDAARVVAFSTVEGWSAGASEDGARAVMEQARAKGDTLPCKVRAFCERHAGEDLPADLIAA